MAAMQPVISPPALIDTVHDRLLEAIIAGTLPAGQPVRQEALAQRLGVSRQPVSHALQLLKRQGLLVESGKRGLEVAPILARRVRQLYQVRTALEELAARLAAERVAAGTAVEPELRAMQDALEAGRALGRSDTITAFVRADVAFHAALHRLSGNVALEEMVGAQWPHLMRAMAASLSDQGMRSRVWAEHGVIHERILAGDRDGAAAAARLHTEQAGEETARRLEAVAAAA